MRIKFTYFMKLLFIIFTTAIFMSVGATCGHAREAVSVDFFYDNLQPHGDWREVGGYGYCWQPHDTGSDWRPYSDGRWVYTDAGWTWDSNEPFGWAVYHYGRWVDVSQVGWVWVPGTEWGPGWVSWRRSPQYVGWAPLPPEARLLQAIGLSTWVDDYYDIGPSHYRFVENRNFGARRLNSVFIDQSRNVSIIHQTTNITNISYFNNVVYNGGPVYDQQLRQSNEPIQRFRLDRRQDHGGELQKQSPEFLRSRIEGDSMSVLALPFTGRSASSPKKLRDKVERVEVNHGWKNAGTQDEIAAMRAGMKSKDKVPDKLPPVNTFRKVTDNASVAEERFTEDRPVMPADRQPKSKGKGSEKTTTPVLPPVAAEKPIRQDDRPPADTRKDKGTQKPMRPDLPPGFPERQIRPEDRPPTSVPKGKDTEKPSRPIIPQSKPDMPNRGGRNKVEAPQLPRSEIRPPVAVEPKVREREKMPQIPPPIPRPAPEKPKAIIPKIAPPKPVPLPRLPQVIKPAPRVPKPSAPDVPKPKKSQGKTKPSGGQNPQSKSKP